MKNSFNCGVLVRTIQPCADVFGRLGGPVTDHWMPPCQWQNDRVAEIDNEVVTVNGMVTCHLPAGSLVATVPVV